MNDLRFLLLVLHLYKLLQKQAVQNYNKQRTRRSFLMQIMAVKLIYSTRLNTGRSKLREIMAG